MYVLGELSTKTKDIAETYFVRKAVEELHRVKIKTPTTLFTKVTKKPEGA